LCADVVLGILQELKPLIAEAHERYVEQQTRLAKRRQEIKSAPPGPPATFKAEQEKWSQRQERDVQSRGSVSRTEEEPWDLLKEMEGIKIVSGRPQVREPLVQRTKLEFQYPSVSQQRYILQCGANTVLTSYIPLHRL
jgi:hypothetical protein